MMLVGNVELTEAIIGAAIEVHKKLGPGLLESAYARCLQHELSLRAIPWQREVPIDLEYKGLLLEAAYRADLLVAGRVIVEVKALQSVLPIHRAQAITYMRLLRVPTGLILNFHQQTLSAGIERLILQ